MTTKRKNRGGHYVISIQSMGFNTTYSTRTGKLIDANRIQREIETRIDSVRVNARHPFHDWAKKDQLEWIKKGVEPKSVKEPVTLYAAVNEFLKHIEVARKAPSSLYGYRLHLEAAKEFFGDIQLVTLTSRRLQDWVDAQAKTKIQKGRNGGQFPAPETIEKSLTN